MNEATARTTTDTLAQDTLSRVCLPEEQLFLGVEHETQERHRFRGFELSFLPSSVPISQLMAALGMDCEQRLARLKEKAKGLQMSEPLVLSHHPGTMPTDMRRQHFFVIDRLMACEALKNALAAGEHSRQFYTQLLAVCSAPELRPLFEEIVEQKENACRILEEVQENARPLKDVSAE
ncbi:hypothetical protein [Vreelandella massiliensis]|uniref:hypothetical protein n=1 Tax=Vreelandella massiliensis TaxID=1816686 RepID=UPI001181A597|nr:hypothetical protein [Halomonas massiliensis]